MQALVLTAYHHLQLEERPTPVPQAGEVLLRVAACGICGSDVHGFDGSSGRRIPPIVMGHEAAGTIAALGPEVSGWAIGDRVTFDSTLYCGHCPFCLAGQVNLCDLRQVFGVSCADYRRDGAFAEFLAVPARILYRLPDALSFPHAAMAEALAVALHALAVSGIQPGQSALVLGAGMIGNLILQSLRVLGATPILVADPDRSRTALALRSGATASLPVSAEDSEATTRALLAAHPTGVQHVFEAVGLGPTVATAVACARKGGTVTLVGNIAAHVPLPLQSVVTRQIRLQGSTASAGEYPRALDLLASGQVDVTPLLSEVLPLTQGPDAFARLHARTPGLTKVVLTPDPAA